MTDDVELQDLADFNPNDLGTWINGPADESKVIEGLQWLSDLDHLLVFSFSPYKAMRVFPAAAHRHFIIRNKEGENVFVANEYPGRRKLCGHRSFSLDVLDKEETKVFSIRSPTNCGILCGCCVPWIEVVTKDETLLGSIEQKCSILQQKYMVRDNRGCAQLRVRGPMRPLCLVKHPELSVMSKSGPLSRGLIVKVGNGKRLEMEVVFSNSLSVELKAVLLAMAFVFEIRNFKPTKVPERPSFQISRTIHRSSTAIALQGNADQPITQ